MLCKIAFFEPQAAYSCFVTELNPLMPDVH